MQPAVRCDDEQRVRDAERILTRGPLRAIAGRALRVRLRWCLPDVCVACTFVWLWVRDWTRRQAAGVVDRDCRCTVLVAIGFSCGPSCGPLLLFDVVLFCVVRYSAVAAHMRAYDWRRRTWRRMGTGRQGIADSLDPSMRVDDWELRRSGNGQVGLAAVLSDADRSLGRGRCRSMLRTLFVLEVQNSAGGCGGPGRATPHRPRNSPTAVIASTTGQKEVPTIASAL